MVCIYTYKGTDYTYEEFRAKLADGLLADAIGSKSVKGLPEDVVQLFSPTETNSVTSNTTNDAIQKQKPAEGVLRDQRIRRESELQSVEQDNKSKIPAQKSEAEEVKSLNKLTSVKSDLFGTVKPHVFAAADNSKIFDAIVGLVPVDVVDVLGREKITPDKFFHDHSVFSESLNSVTKSDVSGRVNDALAVGVARLRTKLLASLASGDFKFSPAELALIKDRDALSLVFGVGESNSFSNLDRMSADALPATELSRLKSIGLDLKGSAADNADFFNKLHRLVLDKGKENSNSNIGSEGNKPKTKVSRTKASGNLRKLSENIRKDGVLPHWAKADLPEGTQSQGFGGKSLDEAVARSLELVADAIDAGKGLSDSVNEGFSHVRDYYAKNTKSFDEKKLKQQYREKIKNLLREGGEVSGITHAETKATREEFGLGEPYEKTTKSDEQLRADAVDEIKKGYDVDKLVGDIEKGKVPSDKETTILKIHKANLEAAIEKNPSDENLSALRRLVKASDAAGSEQGRALRSRQGLEIRDDSLAGYFTREQDIHGETLTPEQKAQVIKEHTEISEAKKKLEEKMAALEKENARLKAAKKVNEQKAKVTVNGKKTKEDFAKERNQILQNIKDKWKNAGKDNMLTAVPVPYAKQLAAIAPDVAKLVRSLVEEGVTKLADVTKNVHDTLKETFPEITEKDVHDIIAGEYSKKKSTKNEIQQKIADLRTQSQLINKLEELQKGPIPKTETERVARTKEIEDLRKRVLDKAKEYSEAAAETKRQVKRIEKLKEKLAILQSGKLPEGKEKAPKVDTPEIEALKKEIEVAEKAVRANMAHEKRMQGLQDELQRLKDRKAKETKPENKRTIGAEEQKLRDQIEAERKKWSDETKRTPEEVSLGAIKSRTRSEIEKLKEQLRTGNFEGDRQPVKLDKEATDLKDELIRLRREREVRLMKEEYAKRSKRQKIVDGFLDIINIPRTIMSSLDFSAPLRQSLVATVAHPSVAAKAGAEMFKQAVSKKRFDRWFHDLRETPRFKLMEQSGLYVADPHDPRLTLKEEAFTSNLAEKIPIVGSGFKVKGVKIGEVKVAGKKVGNFDLIGGSERAYVGYLNKMRVDIFNQFATALEDSGYTFEENPELFKGVANFVNNSTGRGNLGAIESAAPVLNSVFFSPRLIASRFNLLGLGDVTTFGKGMYGSMPKEVRVMALKDMAKFVGVGLTVLSVLRLSSWASGCKDENGEPCLTVEYDPRSTDFGKIKAGNTRWDIWGGMQQYVRIISQLASGQTKSGSGKIEELDGEGLYGKTRGDQLASFARGKLAPVPSMAMDVLTGRTATGEKVTLKDEAKGHLLPLLATDMEDALKDNGVKAIFTVGIPSTFGVGVSTYLPRGYEGKDVKKDPVYSFLYKKDMTIADPSFKDIPEEKQPAFEKRKEQIFKSEWDKVIKYGALLDENGHTTIDHKRAVKRLDTDKLDKEDLSALMRSISTKSTRQTAKEMGIDVGQKPKQRR